TEKNYIVQQDDAHCGGFFLNSFSVQKGEMVGRVSKVDTGPLGQAHYSSNGDTSWNVQKALSALIW
ncbi:hypothetical protein DKP78_18865, partial [Enterococcus faecium]